MAVDEGAGERDLAWLLDDLASRVKDFTRAVILSRDGLLLAASRDLSREEAEHLAAVAAALQSGWLRSRETDDDDTGDSGNSTASGPSVEWLDDTEHDATPPGGTAWHDEEM